LNKREEDLRFGLKHFDITLNSLKDLTDVESELDLLDKIWGIKQKWDTQWEAWKIMKFLDLDTEVMTEITNDFHESVRALEKQIKTWGVWISIREKVDVFMNTLPLITDLRSKAIKDRHWRELKAEVK
jgi:dynein heavy chain